MSYKSTRRQWVKLWVNEWLDGTTRFELTAPQRLLWIDLLALAGRSRFPGLIYAGEGEAGKRVGYPIAYLAGVLQMDEVTLNNALKLLEVHSHITLLESAPEQFIIGIVNWEKYQSEYLRQKTYRKVTTKTTRRLPVEVEVEGDVDGEEKKNTSPTKTVGGELGSYEFRAFWNAYPKRVDRQEALRSWVKGLLDGSLGEILAGLEKWKATEQWSEYDKIPYPSTWLNKRRWRETPEASVSKAENKARKTDEAIERVRARLHPELAAKTE